MKVRNLLKTKPIKSRNKIKKLKNLNFKLNHKMIKILKPKAK